MLTGVSGVLNVTCTYDPCGFNPAAVSPQNYWFYNNVSGILDISIPSANWFTFHSSFQNDGTVYVRRGTLELQVRRQGAEAEMSRAARSSTRALSLCRPART